MFPGLMTGLMRGRVNPLSLTPLLWFGKADGDITDISGKADEWADSSANGTDAVAAAEANRPTIIDDFAGTGRKGLRFDGVNDKLIATIGAGTRSVFSVYLAVQVEKTGANDQIIELDFQLMSEATDNFRVYNPQGDTVLSSGAEAAGVRVVHFTWENGGADEIELFVDNVSIGSITNTSSSTVSNTAFVIGDNAVNANFTIGELLVYEDLHTPAEQRRVYNYLRTRWQEQYLIIPAAIPLDGTTEYETIAAADVNGRLLDGKWSMTFTLGSDYAVAIEQPLRISNDDRLMLHTSGDFRWYVGGLTKSVTYAAAGSPVDGDEIVWTVDFVTGDWSISVNGGAAVAGPNHGAGDSWPSAVDVLICKAGSISEFNGTDVYPPVGLTPFDPDDIAGLFVRLDERNITGTTTVTSWLDQKNERDFVPDTSDEPSRVENWNGTGMPAIRFDANNEVLRATIDKGGTSDRYTVFLAMEIDSAASGQRFWVYDGSLREGTTAGRPRQYTPPNNNYQSTVGGLVPQVVAAKWRDGITTQAHRIFVDGVDGGGAANTLAGTIADNTLMSIGGNGITAGSACTIAEVLVYDAELTDDEILTVSNYLATKWGI